MRSSVLIKCLGLPVKSFEPGFQTVYWKENRNKRSDHLATRETASYILFRAKTQIYKQNTYRKWSWKQ